MRGVRSLSGLAGANASLKDAGAASGGSSGGVINLENTKQITGVRAAQMSPDGLKLYTLETTSAPTVGAYEYDLSTPFDLTSAGTRTDSTLTSTCEYGGQIQWKSDGTKFIISGHYNSPADLKFTAYTAATPWTMTGATQYFTRTVTTDPAQYPRVSLDGAVVYFNQGRYKTIGADWDFGSWSAVYSSFGNGYDGGISGFAGSTMREVNQYHVLGDIDTPPLVIYPLTVTNDITSGVGSAAGSLPVLSDLDLINDPHNYPEFVGEDYQYCLVYGADYVALYGA